eukprot:FR738057.1.p1 GENE.FR738057.1~~FR738057.1.p1  ORF type:complete len:197 (+),score=16.71 FR738057.1:2-592(+)
MLGIMAYELLTGRRPYKESVSKNTIKYVQKCLEGNTLDDDLPESHIPAAPDSKYNLSAECLSCVKGLLEPRPWKRLSTKKFEDGFMKHPWFADFDWESAKKRDKVKLPAPVKPKPNTANCDTVGNNLVDSLMGEEQHVKLTPEEQTKFNDYGYMDRLDPISGDVVGHSTGVGVEKPASPVPPLSLPVSADEPAVNE